MWRKLARPLRRKAYEHYLRSSLPYRFPRYLATEKHAGAYSILSTAPPIFHVPHWMNDRLVLSQDLSLLFERLASTRAYFLYKWMWWIEAPARVAQVKRFEAQHLRRYPKHEFIHLCNTPRQHQLFSEGGLNAIFCSQNAFVDDRIFKPLPEMVKTWDAVYDGRFKGYKRHELAVLLPNLALIYAFNPLVDDPAVVQAVRRQFPQAHFFNHDAGGEYFKLTPSEVTVCLNQCRVGLILSQVEGANAASIQYLLCGLPVVSTRSIGGRDVFFDDEYVMVVDDNAEAVRAGVEEMLKRDLAPERIRARTLAKIQPHRDRLIECVQQIYDREGVPRRFADEWDGVFCHKLTRYQSHVETFERLDAANR